MLFRSITREGKNKIDELLSEKNMELIADILNVSDFCDIEIVREYLIEYFAKLIRRNGIDLF